MEKTRPFSILALSRLNTLDMIGKLVDRLKAKGLYTVSESRMTRSGGLWRSISASGERKRHTTTHNR